MCVGQSLHVGLINDVPKVWIRAGYGSHDDDRKHFGIHDEAVGWVVAALECVPRGPDLDLDNPDSWAVQFDGNHVPPAWWNHQCQEAAEREARAAISAVAKTGVWPGNLILAIQTIGHWSLASVGGYFDARSLADAKGLSALASIGGYFCANSLVDATGLSALARVGHEFYARSLADTTGLSALASVGGDFYVESLTETERAQIPALLS